MDFSRKSVEKEIAKREKEIGELRSMISNMDKILSMFDNGEVAVKKKRKYKRRYKRRDKRRSSAQKEKLSIIMKNRWKKAYAAGRNAL